MKKKKVTLEEEFPHDSFPWKLTYQDGKEKKNCFFQSEDHRKKHIQRYNLKNKDIKLSYKYD